MRLVLFDVDGTLLLARGAGRRALTRALVEVYGTAGTMEHYDLRGKTDMAVVHEVLEAAGVPRAGVAALRERCFEVYARRLADEIGNGLAVETLPGVASLIQRLTEAGALLGLLTGNTEAGAHIKLAPTGLRPYFRTGAYGCEDLDRRRLAALAVERAGTVARQGFRPGDVVVVGDTPHDVDCARAVGAVAVAVATGQVAREELLAARPDLLFDSFADAERAAAALLSA